MTERELYPEIEPFDSFRMKVSDLHEIYVEQAGNPQGQPVLFIHGGPGGGIDAKHRRYFDPQHYHIILFDQRGAGKSTPYAEIENNTTPDLISDMEKIRNKLGLEKWILFGGSWGSTLALCYAIEHPQRVSGMILRGIFLCRTEELYWFYQSGADRIFPDAFEDYRDFIPKDEQNDLMQAYSKRLFSDDKEKQIEAARSWSKWEGSALRLVPDQETLDDFDEISLALARIECHYFLNGAFLKSGNWILENAGKLQKIRTHIIHGRYDMVCPAKNAWDLHKAIPHSTLEFIPTAGHAGSETGIIDALIRATDAFRS